MCALFIQAVSVCRGTSYLEKNKRVRSHVNVAERERGGTVIKADINRLICHCPSKVRGGGEEEEEAVVVVVKEGERESFIRNVGVHCEVRRVHGAGVGVCAI